MISTKIDREPSTDVPRTRRLRRDRLGVPGLKMQGETSPMAKLTEQKVREIREAEGSISSIAKRYKIARAHVRQIKDRKIWKHVA